MQTDELRAPFPWFGGKRRIASLVWERFGHVPNYVEPFAGSLFDDADDLQFPESWTCIPWKATGGYGRSARGIANAHRERIWVSPHCLSPEVTQHHSLGGMAL